MSCAKHPIVLVAFGRRPIHLGWACCALAASTAAVAASTSHDRALAAGGGGDERCASEQLLMQLRPAQLSTALPLAPEGACHTAVEGESECYERVDWAMRFGIYSDPDWYPGLSVTSSFVEFQAWLHSSGDHGCPKPCPTMAQPSTAAPLAPEAACHTAVQGEESECYEHADWAMRFGIYSHPDWYPGLSVTSSFVDFQAWLHSKGELGCPKPCPIEVVTPSAPVEVSSMPQPDQGSSTTVLSPAASDSRFATVSQTTALIQVGGEVRFYVIGTSNVAWQTWPDQLHAMLRDLGYVVPSQAYTLTNLVRPSSGPICDNMNEFAGLETPRIGKVGWASWGFAYDSKEDCTPAEFEGQPEIGQHGFRQIAGHRVSCINSWACNPAGQGKGTLVSPSAVAEDVKAADVVLLSNWINDSKQRWSQFKCYKSEAVDFVDTTDITVVNLRRLIQAIHSKNPETIVLIMALYPGSSGPFVIESSLALTAEINEKVRTRVNEPNTFFVDYTVPVRQDVFQTKHPGHLNCRGDKVLATRVLEVMFDAGVLARSLALPKGDDSARCLAETACEAMVDKSCCQRSASCYVDTQGLCKSYGPGAQ